MRNQLSGCSADYTHCSCRLQREEESNLWEISYHLNKLPENQKVTIPLSQNQRMSSKSTEEESSSSRTTSQSSASQLSVRGFEDDLRGFPHLSTPLNARRTVNGSHFYANDRELDRPTSDIETLLRSFSAPSTNPPIQNAHGALLYTPVSFSYTDPDDIVARNDVPSLQFRYEPKRGPRPSTMQSPEETLVPNGMSSSSIPLQSVLRTSSSVSSDDTEHLPLVKTGLYKTELCRSWEETGNCRYATKCQFAHGNEDLRPVPRHPKYKTEMCRSYTETGLCSYGKRCRFIHRSNSMSSFCSQAPTRSGEPQKHRSRRLSIFQQLCLRGEQPSRQA